MTCFSIDVSCGYGVQYMIDLDHFKQTTQDTRKKVFASNLNVPFFKKNILLQLYELSSSQRGRWSLIQDRPMLPLGWLDKGNLK